MAETPSVLVRFDRERPIYRPGETVSGRVECNFKEPKKAEKLVCKLRGKTRIVITRTESAGPSGAAQTRTYRAKKYHVREDIELVDVESEYMGILPAGTYTFPFSFVLPEELPPSFLGTGGMAGIIYYCRAKLVKKKSPLPSRIFRGKKRSKTQPEYGLIVVLPLEPMDNSVPRLDLTVTKTTKAGGLMGLFFGKPISCSATLESGTALRFGNTALVTVNVNNQSSGTVDGITARLEHFTKYSVSTVEEQRLDVLAKTAPICAKKIDGRHVQKYTNSDNVQIELVLPQSLPYSKPDAPPGRLVQFPSATARKLDKKHPGAYAWPFLHHMSPSTDPDDMGLSPPYIQSSYRIVVKFNVRKGLSTKLRIPVTMHEGVTAREALEYDAEDDDDIDMITSVDNLMLSGGAKGGKGGKT